MSYRQFEIVTKTLFKYGLINGLQIIYKLQLCKNSKREGIVNIRLNKLNNLVVSIRRKSSDWLVFVEVFIDEVYQVNSSNIRVVFDLGANCGLTSLYYSAKFPDARIVSVEPEKGNCKLLRHNTRRFSNIFVEEVAIANKTGEFELFDPGNGDWGFSMVKSSKKDAMYKVRCETIPNLMKKYDVSIIDILKIDIEGAERDILINPYNTFLSSTRNLIIELHSDVDGSVSSFSQGLNDYAPYSIVGAGGNLVLTFNSGN